MEFVDGFILMADGCFCFLEFATLFFDSAAVYSGVKTYQKHKKAKEHALRKPSWTPFVLLFILGVVFTALTVYKYLKH